MSQETVSISQPINATPAQVWALIGNFHGIMDWFPGVTEC